MKLERSQLSMEHFQSGVMDGAVIRTGVAYQKKQIDFKTGQVIGVTPEVEWTAPYRVEKVVKETIEGEEATRLVVQMRDALDRIVTIPAEGVVAGAHGAYRFDGAILDPKRAKWGKRNNILNNNSR